MIDRYDRFLHGLETAVATARTLGLYRTAKELHAALNEGRSERFEAQPPPITVTGGGLRFQLLPVVIGDTMNYVVTDDHADEPYVLAPISAKDVEGNDLPLDAPVVESSDPTVVAVTPGADPAAGGMASFGNPGQATVTETVKRSDTGEIISP